MNKGFVSYFIALWVRGRRASAKGPALLAFAMVAVLALGSVVLAGGPIGSELQLTTMDNDREPEIAHDSANGRYLVVARHYNGSNNNDVLAQIVNADGTRGAWNWIADSSDNEVYPDVAYSSADGEYLVVYVQWQTIGRKKKNRAKVSHVVRGQRVGPDGTRFGDPFDISPHHSDTVTYSRVAYNATSQNYVVVWEIAEKVGKGRHAPRGVIRGARVSIGPTGSVSIGDAETYAAGGYDTGCGGLDIAADNVHGRFLVIFPYCMDEAEVFGRLAGAAGEPLGTAPFLIASEPGVHLDAQSVAYGDNQYLVAFVRPGLANHEFRARWVSHDGTPQGDADGILVYDPEVEDGVTDGGMAVEYGLTSFLVTWIYDPIPNGEFDRHVFGREIRTDGSMDAEFAISEAGNNLAPALVLDTQSQILVVWSHVPETWPGNTPANIWGRWWGP